MKIAITSKGPTLNDFVEPSFGLSAYFILIDPDTMACEPVPNPYIQPFSDENESDEYCVPWYQAPPSPAVCLKDKDVSIVLTGRCSRKNTRVCEKSGIAVISGLNGQVQDAVHEYKNHNLNNSHSSILSYPILREPREGEKDEHR